MPRKTTAVTGEAGRGAGRGGSILAVADPAEAMGGTSPVTDVTDPGVSVPLTAAGIPVVPR